MHIKDLLLQSQKRVEKSSRNDSNYSGIRSGFDAIDDITGGWQDSNLIVIGGRPGMGKTSFILSMCRNMLIDYHKSVLLFCIEAKAKDIVDKMLVCEMGFSLNKLRTGKLLKHDWEAFNVKSQILGNTSFYIVDTPSISIETLENKIKQHVLRQNVEIVLIDYLQLITIDDKNIIATNREQFISIIMGKLKSIAKELDVPIIVTSQLNRGLEERAGSKRPLLSDLRESGAIEQDADIVSFIYRPEYYKIDEWDDEERSPTQGQGEFIVAKHRNGGLDNIRLKFIGHLGKFDNLDDFDAPFNQEFHSKMNAGDDDGGMPGSFPSASDAFGPPIPPPSSDDDVPF